LHLGVVGGGAGGVELAISLLARLRQARPKHWAPEASPEPLQHQIHLFQRGPTLLPNHGAGVGQKFLQILQNQGVTVHLNSAVTSVMPVAGTSNSADASPDVAALDRERYEQDFKLLVHHEQGVERCDRLFWVTHASAPAWLAASGLATDNRGFVQVSDTLQSLSHPFVLAAGDIAAMVNHPRPKAGVFAVRQGQPLFENLQRLLQQQEPRPFVPQRRLLALIGTGQGAAVASRGRWSLGPWKWLWRWKDHIDRQFMARFAELPVMAAASAQSAPAQSAPAQSVPAQSAPARSAPAQSSPDQSFPAMYCAGCGAKVASRVLERSLGRLRSQFPALISQEPDDAAVLQPPVGQRLLQTLDYFPALVNDPFVCGQITANHCLNDILAMGATPHSVLALVQVPHGAIAPRKRCSTNSSPERWRYSPSNRFS
ncbi:MAG: FAD-dependent oxidoreductase, partial [Synechococcales cyanobacterium RM1_1_8]|nr:FAD-dependent oxidoreductase [Synechococcales cyanobacterium RM1_1_8]